VKRLDLIPVIGLALVFVVFLSGAVSLHAASVKVEPLKEGDFSRLLKNHKDRVVLVNVWATWCKPCREEFPDLVKLQEYYKDKDVRVITISADYPDEVESKIIPFLKKFKINFPVYVQNFKKQENFIDMMNKEWNGALPATFIYGKTGRQRAFFIGKKDFEGFKTQIEKIRQ
jgi:thiol-disulfide isomerase/thioredoxin